MFITFLGNVKKKFSLKNFREVVFNRKFRKLLRNTK